MRAKDKSRPRKKQAKAIETKYARP